ncbi:uncharacterized protein LOC101892766 [Musca domestica]|uniref:Uncharacterized protein LOC101892766 n=1 Tax=Musca domestica TaxID=7370 RepID=A0A9J7CI09_MUSDO|nr:uncharacterized protein LOC101892766 [Musca domestica]
MSSNRRWCIAIVFLAMMMAMVASQGAILRGNKKHPTLDYHCYDDDHELTIKVNETYFSDGSEKKCLSVYCRDDYVIRINGCQRSSKICEPDYTKPYPECCVTSC